jgi:hypothetical protein
MNAYGRFPSGTPTRRVPVFDGFRAGRPAAMTSEAR